MSARDSMTGAVFNGRYEIKDRIGIGGMAEVYRALDNVLGRTVAVKVMLPQYAADPDFTQRFRQEAAAAANLQSPYIVNVYDWGQDEGTYFIVMEFVRGSDLKTAIQQRGAINQRKVAEIGAQVCQALTVAHNLDIIHRDIKPQNIMVQPDGNVKVMDFGIARAKNSLRQQTSAVLGTAHYISPEQAQGKELTAASDIYSLGIVMYEAVTGKLPFDGPDAVSVALKQVKEPPIPPRQINPDIDPGLQEIILKAMAKNPQDRFTTANDMRLALNDYLAGRPVNVGPIAGAALGAAAGAGFTSAATAMMPNAAGAQATHVMNPAMSGRNGSGRLDSTQMMQNPAASGRGPNGGYQAEPPKKKSRKALWITLAIVGALVVAGLIVWLVLASGTATKPVPYVVGMTYEQAQASLEEDGFKVTKNLSYDANVEENHVITQDPAGGTERPEGTTVTLTVSQGVQQITLPDLTGKTVEEARELANGNFTLSAAPGEYSSTIEKNRIIKQNPPAGTEVAKGSVVEYTISLGVEVRDVPNVVGDYASEAQAQLEAEGFKVSVQHSYSSSVDKGYVISMSPNGKADVGTTITITVSDGPRPQPTDPGTSGGSGSGTSGSGSGTGGNGGGSGSGTGGSGSGTGGGDAGGTGGTGSTGGDASGGTQ